MRMCYGPLYDPDAVQRAHAAGVGVRISNLALGGRHAPEMLGGPIQVNATVRILTDGEFSWTGPMCQGLAVHLGRTALLKVDLGSSSNTLDIVVSSNRLQPY